MSFPPQNVFNCIIIQGLKVPIVEETPIYVLHRRFFSSPCHCQKSFSIYGTVLKPALLCVSADLIYEDIQKEEGLQGPNNGWSSSEFESYDEQSDSERAPTRSKVRVCVCVC